MFHVECLYKILRQKWNGPRITFAFLECPKCKTQISAPHCKQLNEEIISALELKTNVSTKALLRAEHEGLHKADRLKLEGDRFFNDLPALAMFKLAYYICFKCQKPYYGGMKDCI